MFPHLPGSLTALEPPAPSIEAGAWFKVKRYLVSCNQSLGSITIHNMAKNPHAAALGRRGGRARMDNLSAEERKQLGREGGKASGEARRAKANARKKAGKPAKKR